MRRRVGCGPTLEEITLHSGRYGGCGWNGPWKVTDERQRFSRCVDGPERFQGRASIIGVRIVEGELLYVLARH